MTSEYGNISREMFEFTILMRRLGMKTMHGQQGIHHGKGHVLNVLAHQDNLSQAELSKQIGIRPASLTDLLEKMEKDQLVRRTKDPQDRRVSRVTLSPRGREIINQNQEIHRKVDEMVYSGLTQTEVAELDRILKKLLASLHQNDDLSPMEFHQFWSDQQKKWGESHND